MGSLWVEECALGSPGVSSTKMIFGLLPSLPGQFLAAPELSSYQLHDLLHCLMDPFQPLLLVHNSSVLSALWEAEFVFVRRDGAKWILSPLYDEPYQVISRSLIGGKEDNVTMARLKPLLALGSV